VYQQVSARGLALSAPARVEARRGWRHGNPAATRPIKHQPSISTATSSFVCIHIMVYLSGFALCAAVTGAGALQLPIFSSHNQAPLGHPHGSKPLVNSTELQDLISGDRLMTRAKKLYEIAKLGEEEYNHPTRVIGSAGKMLPCCDCFGRPLITD
jgi:hypothetical protein